MSRFAHSAVCTNILPMYIYIYIHTYNYTELYNIDIHIYIYIHTYIFLCVYMYVCIYIYTWWQQNLLTAAGFDECMLHGADQAMMVLLLMLLGSSKFDGISASLKQVSQLCRFRGDISLFLDCAVLLAWLQGSYMVVN